MVLKHFVMAEMFESVESWRLCRKLAEANWVISDYLQGFVEDSQVPEDWRRTNIEPAYEKQSWRLRNYSLVGPNFSLWADPKEIIKQPLANAQEKIIILKERNKMKM